MATIDSAPCKSCATRARHGLDGMCPTCANERTSGRSTLARDGVAGERLSDEHLDLRLRNLAESEKADPDAYAEACAYRELQARRAADLTPEEVAAVRDLLLSLDGEPRAMRCALTKILAAHGVRP